MPSCDNNVLIALGLGVAIGMGFGFLFALFTERIFPTGGQK